MEIHGDGILQRFFYGDICIFVRKDAPLSDTNGGQRIEGGRRRRKRNQITVFKNSSREAAAAPYPATPPFFMDEVPSVEYSC